MNKIAHFYWGGNKLSYLRYLTLKSFIVFNPDWEIRLYVPKEHNTQIPTWVSQAHKIRYTGPDYMPNVKDLGITPRVFDFHAAGFPHDIHEAQKSDFLRWYVLYHSGGFWSDIDIIFTKPLTVDIFDTHDFCITADKSPPVYYIAYIYCRKCCPIMGVILRAASNSANYSPTNYQCLGNVLVAKCFNDIINSFRQFPDLQVHIFDPSINLPVKRIRDIGKIFEQSRAVDLSGSVGLHWFGGHPMAGKWENIINPEIVSHCETTICQVIKDLGI